MVHCVYCWQPLTNEIKLQQKSALTNGCAEVIGRCDLK